MKTAIYLTLIALVIPAIFFVYLLYVGHKAWERAWVKVESIQGPDGYTYCLMFETGLGQDSYTKLSRTKTPEDETTYEDLGSVNELSSWLTVIRPAALAQHTKNRLRVTSNNMIFINCYSLGNHVPFVYDVAANWFYDHYDDNNQMSPFILIENEDAELYKPDVAWVLERVLQEYKSYIHQKEYVAEYFNDANAPTRFGVDKYTPEWPTREALEAGLAHPNKEVRKIAAWLLHIQQNGLDDSEAGREIRAFLDKYGHR